MEVRQLQMFLAVVDEGRVVKAAERQHVAQSVVSKQVARLERELGLVLFDRRRRSATLTRAGEQFVPHARWVLRSVEDARRAAEAIRKPASIRLRVGTSQGLGPRLGVVLSAFRESSPNVRVQLGLLNTPAKLLALDEGRLDAAFVRAPTPEVLKASGIRWSPLWDDELVAVVPTRWADKPLLEIGRSLPLARAARERNPGVWAIITEACQRQGFQSPAGPDLSSIDEVIHGPIAGGEAWTFLYRTSVTSVPGVEVLEVSPPPVVVTGIAVAASPRQAALDLVEVAQASSR